MRILLCIIVSLNIIGQRSADAQTNEQITISEGLILIKLNDNLYQHVSDVQYQSRTVKCNGLIYVNGTEAIICDTPTNDVYSAELLQWWNNNYPDVKVKAVIVNHFHADCLGGLKEFHKAGIKSYGHVLGPELMKLKGDTLEVPQNLFSNVANIKVGNATVQNFYPGEAHTRDNIVTWIPGEKVIFGGCMVKSMHAEKGNLADANVGAWPATIKNVKLKYPKARLIIPGHGDPGGMELLDYTIRLFE
jgi:metallo-beta-lactamase class B